MHSGWLLLSSHRELEQFDYGNSSEFFRKIDRDFSIMISKNTVNTLNDVKGFYNSDKVKLVSGGN